MRVVMLRQCVIGPGKVGYLPGEDENNDTGIYEVSLTAGNLLLASGNARLARSEDSDNKPAKVVEPLKQVEPPKEEKEEEPKTEESPANIDQLDSMKWGDIKVLARNLSLPCNMKKAELIEEIRKAQAHL